MLKIDISPAPYIGLRGEGGGRGWDLLQKQYYNWPTAVFSLRHEARTMLLAATINLLCCGAGRFYITNTASYNNDGKVSK